MKFLTDRQEIAKEININGTPVITIEIGEEMKGWEGYRCYEGSTVKVATPSPRYPDSYARCTVHMFGDENKGIANPWEFKSIDLNCYGTCLSASFGYSDVMDMIKWSNSPMVKADDKVVVIFNDSKNRTCYIRKMKIGKVSPFCSTVAKLYDIDEEA